MTELEIEKVYEDLAAYYKEIADHNNHFLETLGEEQIKHFNELLDCCNVTEKITFVDAPKWYDIKEEYASIKQQSDGSGEERFKLAYGVYWDKVKDVIDAEGWVYTKEVPHLFDAYFEGNTGKQIEFQKSFGKSGENPHWLTRGSRWRPVELSITTDQSLNK